MIHATAASGWSLSGSLLTFAFPMALIAVAATVLYLLFSRPHQVPGHNRLAFAQPVPPPPDPGTAQAMAAAAGLPTAAGGGITTLAQEPHGAEAEAQATAEAAATAEESTTDVPSSDGPETSA
jgi:hypothetical protein